MIKLGTVLWNPQNLSEEQLRFAAEKFDAFNLGGGNTKSVYAEKLLYYNPKLKVFSYINSRQVPDNNYWNQMWESNPDIFARDENGDRIKNTVFNQWLMNIDNPEWTNLILEWANGLSPDIDGIFLDDACPKLHSSYEAFPKDYDPDQYAISMANLLSSVKNNTSGLVVFNGLEKGLKYEGYIDDMDGGILEGFIFSRNIQVIELGRVYNHLNTLIEMGKTDKITTICTKSYMDNVDNRIFALACYLLGSYENSIYNFMDLNYEHSDPLQYYPEYEIDLGYPIDFPNKVEELLDPITNLAVRHFENGMVVVNPWNDDINIQLDAKYDKIVTHGGGIVGNNGTYDGYLTYESVSGSMTVPKGSAMILLTATEPVTSEVIVDNGDPGTSHKGNWWLSNVAQSFGDSSLFGRNWWFTRGNYAWTADIQGNLEVSMWWVTKRNSNRNVRINIYDGKSHIDTIYVNQRENGGKWNVLRTYVFKSMPKIVIHSSRWAVTCADAVKFVVT